MKKFLFTLATLIAAGFAANASCPQLALSDTEITLGAGESQEVHIQLLEGLDEIMLGAQIQFVMYNPAGERIADAVILQKKYSRNSQWFGAETISKANEEGNEGNAVGTSNPFTGKYRALLSNASSNKFWFPESQYVEWEIPHTYPINVLAFTVKVNAEDWADEYAILRLEANPKSMEEEGEDEYPLKLSCASKTYVLEDGAMELKINNKDYQGTTTTPLTGTIVIGGEDNNYEVPITVDVNGTYDLVVTVAKDGGEAVEVPVNDGKIVLGVEPEYGTYVINATANGNGDYSGAVTATPATVNIEQPKKADPTINFEVGADGTVNIVIEGATRYEVKVDGVLYDGLSVAPIYDATQEVVVEAWNEAEGYIAGYKTNSTTVAEKAYAPAVNPTITFVPGETGVTINVEDYTSYEVIVDGVNMGQINFVEKTWEEQKIVVNAVNEPEHQLKGEATESYTLAAKGDEDMPGTLTIGAVDQATGLVHIAYVGDVDVTIEVTYGVREVVTINGKEGDIQLTEKGVTYHIVAVAKAAHYVDMTAEADRIWNESEFTTPDPVTSYDEATFTITAQPGENSPEGTVVAIYVGGQKVAEGVGTQTYVIPQTDADQYVSYYATATAPADAADIVYPGMSQSATAFVPAAQPQAQTMQPDMNVIGKQGVVGQFVTLSPAEGEPEETQIWYRYAVNGGEFTDWMLYTGEVALTNPGEYTFECKAQAPGKAESTVKSSSFTVSSIPTSINEIMNAENVANVRFFNVAGQEMNEINGLTIVVVTYTNGQTVATKVMK